MHIIHCCCGAEARSIHGVRNTVGKLDRHILVRGKGGLWVDGSGCGWWKVICTPLSPPFLRRFAGPSTPYFSAATQDTKSQRHYRVPHRAAEEVGNGMEGSVVRDAKCVYILGVCTPHCTACTHSRISPVGVADASTFHVFDSLATVFVFIQRAIIRDLCSFRPR